MEGVACFFVLGIIAIVIIFIALSGKASKSEVESLKNGLSFLESKVKQLSERLATIEKEGVILPQEKKEVQEKTPEAIPEKIIVEKEAKEEEIIAEPIQEKEVEREAVPPLKETKEVPPPSIPVKKVSGPIPKPQQFLSPTKESRLFETISPPPSKKTRSGGFEKKIGVYLAVWVGAITLAIAGGFLVKYSIEKGMLTNTMKITLATILGAILLLFGEFLRKKALPTAQGSSAAGVAVLYASFLAATSLYKLFPLGTGFLLLCLVTAVAIALSLRQGVIVAIIGLIGGFFTPYLIGQYSTSPSKLFVYLILLQGALVFVSQKRNWRGLAFLTLLMGFVSVVQKFFLQMSSVDAIWIGAFIVVSTSLFVLASKRFGEQERSFSFIGETPFDQIVSYTSIIGAILCVAVLAIKTNFPMEQWLFLALLCIATLALGTFDERYEKMPYTSFILITILIAGWALGNLTQKRTMSEVLLVCGGLLLIYGILPSLILLRGKAPTMWATLSSLGGAISFLIAWSSDKRSENLISHWGIVTVFLAFLYLPITLKCKGLLMKKEIYTNALASFAVVITFFVSFSIPLELKREWITVAWALESLALGFLLYKFRIKVIGYLGIIVSLFVGVRLLLNPLVLKYPIGHIPILNWLLYGYGIPALATAFASIYYRKAKWFSEAKYFAYLSGAFTFALLTLETRHFFHLWSFPFGETTLIEWATYSNIWLLAGFLLLLLSKAIKGKNMAVVGNAFFLVSVVKILIVDISFKNPLFSSSEMGNIPVLNWLLYVYGFPLLLLIMSRYFYYRDVNAPQSLINVNYFMNHLLAFVLLTLEIRHFFEPQILLSKKITLVECATYSHFWILLSALFFFLSSKLKTIFSSEAGKIILSVAFVKIFFAEILFYNPLIVHHDVGSLPLLNWLIYIYFVPIILLYPIYKLSRYAPLILSNIAKYVCSAMMFFAFVFSTIEVRQYFHGNFLDGGNILFNESATYSHLWILLACLFLFLNYKFKTPLTAVASKIVIVIAVIKIFLYDVIIANPVFYHHNVGTLPILNYLIYVYFLPILLFYLLYRLFDKTGAIKDIKPLLLYFSMFLSLVFLILEVRQYFHGNFIDEKTVLQKENYTYSVVLILYSFALLIFGVIKKNQFSRIASLIVIYLAVAKVFVYDLRQLKDLYRVTSFLALGISLLVVSYLYQRFVFGTGEKEE